MTRKILLLLALPTALYLTNFLLSCGLAPYDAWVCKMNLYTDGNTAKDTVTITSGTYLYFSAFPQTTCSRPMLPGINTAYANKRCANWQNGIDSSSLRLKLNRPIVCGTDTIAAYTDLLSRPSFSQFARFTKTSGDCAGIMYSLRCTKELMNAIEWESGYYTLYASCTTTNGAPLSDSLAVLFAK
jgi:hypothetical protein